MKYSIIFTTVITLALTSQLATASDIDYPDNLVSGDKLTADMMNNIKTAVNSKQNKVDPLGCPTGYSIRVINADGTVSCELDSNTTYSAGTGLTLTDTTFSVTTELKTGYVSINASAANPIRNTYVYYNNWGTIENSDGTSDFWIVPVNIPHHNATITSYTAYWVDTDATDELDTTLIRVQRNGSNKENLAAASSSGSGGVGESVATTIDTPIVDNINYSYAIYVYMPTSSMKYAGGLIQYTY